MSAAATGSDTQRLGDVLGRKRGRPEERTDARALRLMAKVARLYHDRGLKQEHIGQLLDLSQATVSRLLRRAIKEQVVRITISVPPGSCPDLEDALQNAYGLREAMVVDVPSSDRREVLRELGAAAAYYLENTLSSTDVLGIPAGGDELLSVLDALNAPLPALAARVVQLVGGIGPTSSEAHGARMTQRFAQLLGSEALLLSAPGVVASAESRRLLMKEPFLADALEQIQHVTVALVNVRSADGERTLIGASDAIAPREWDELVAGGAVGDVCMRFFDDDGQPVPSRFDERVIGVTLDQLRSVPRRIAVATGSEKLRAVRGALAARTINVLITDRASAEKLVTRSAARARSWAASVNLTVDQRLSGGRRRASVSTT
jgi:DNA-binding transcriptional regulator LsrR (DeoR family)